MKIDKLDQHLVNSIIADYLFKEKFVLIIGRTYQETDAMNVQVASTMDNLGYKPEPHNYTHHFKKWIKTGGIWFESSTTQFAGKLSGTSLIIIDPRSPYQDIAWGVLENYIPPTTKIMWCHL